MLPPRLASDHVKDQLTQWLANALKCELFPREGDSIANVELPSFSRVEFRMASRSEGDDTHVIRLTANDGKVYCLQVQYEGRGE